MTGQKIGIAFSLDSSSGKVQRSDRKSVKKANELEEPLSKRELTTKEKIILLEASKLHGSRFPPWMSSPISSEFERSVGQPCFM